MARRSTNYRQEKLNLKIDDSSCSDFGTQLMCVHCAGPVAFALLREVAPHTRAFCHDTFGPSFTPFSSWDRRWGKVP
eukprot:1399249-Amphidinium_carterae.1